MCPSSRSGVSSICPGRNGYAERIDESATCRRIRNTPPAIGTQLRLDGGKPPEVGIDCGYQPRFH